MNPLLILGLLAGGFFLYTRQSQIMAEQQRAAQPAKAADPNLPDMSTVKLPDWATIPSTSSSTPTIALPTGADPDLTAPSVPSLADAIKTIGELPDAGGLRTSALAAYQSPRSADSLDALAAELISVSPRVAALFNARAQQIRAAGSI